MVEGTQLGRGGRDEFLAMAPHVPETDRQAIAALIHDTRNMVMALDLYCDLLEAPGVLGAPYRHYASELRLVSGASRRLLDTLDRLGTPDAPGIFNTHDRPGEKKISLHTSSKAQEAKSVMALNRTDSAGNQGSTISFSWMQERGVGAKARADGPAASSDSASGLGDSGLESAFGSGFPAGIEALPGSRASAESALPADGVVAWPENRKRNAVFPVERTIENLAAELRANQNLLSALAGPGVMVDVAIAGGSIPVAMAPEDFTRVVVNLVRNAAEVMPEGGYLQVALEEGPQFVTLTFTDSGPGIARNVLDKIFSPGYSSHALARQAEDGVSEPRGISLTKPRPRAESDRLELDEADKTGTDKTGTDKARTEKASTEKTGADTAWPVQHRGLGLSIVRAIVTAAGGSVWASNCEEGFDGMTPEAAREGKAHGAVIHIEFPLRASVYGP